jgi:drug/metabolite transporter (DMT)-like permease
MNEQKLPMKVWIAFFILCMVWGTTYLAIKVGIQYIPPFTMSGLRNIISGIIFLIYTFLQKEKMPNSKTLLQLLVIGILLIFGGNGLVSWAENYISSGLTAVICSITPIYMTLLSVYFIKGFKTNKYIVLGLMLSIIGIGLIFKNEMQNEWNSLAILGIILITIANISWAIGTILLKKTKMEISILMGVGFQMFFGGIVNLFIGFMVENNTKIMETPIKGWLAMSYLIVFGSLIGYYCYIYLIKNMQPARLSIHTYANTIIAVLLGSLILKETITMFTIIGMMITLLGVWVVNKEYSKLRNVD